MKMAILGPKGTFSELAYLKYQEKTNCPFSCGFFNTIDETIKSLYNGYDYAIVPIENTLDGYVQRTLDLLLEENIYIVDQVTIPISFKLVSNTKIEEIDNLYVQFKAYGQCINFLNNYHNIKIINTDSNVTSYLLWQENKKNNGAVVPSHLNVESKYIYENITDSLNNDTRFFIITKEPTNNIYQNIRVPIYINPLGEYAGLLYNILKVFNDNKINLTSILSRPKKSKMGEYNFYIEVETTYQKLTQLLDNIKHFNNQFEIKILGIINSKD